MADLHARLISAMQEPWEMSLAVGETGVCHNKISAELNLLEEQNATLKHNKNKTKKKCLSNLPDLKKSRRCRIMNNYLPSTKFTKLYS